MNKDKAYYAKTMEVQCQPYDIKCVGKASKGYFFEGHPNYAQWEDVYELINLVEMISRKLSIPVLDSHIVENDKDFIVFTVPEYKEDEMKLQANSATSVTINPIVDVKTFAKLLERGSRQNTAPVMDGLCDMIINDCVNDIEANPGNIDSICKAYREYLDVMEKFSGNPELSNVTIEDFEELLDNPEGYLNN